MEGGCCFENVRTNKYMKLSGKKKLWMGFLETKILFGGCCMRGG
jgi:hypothetical protein